MNKYLKSALIDFFGDLLSIIAGGLAIGLIFLFLLWPIIPAIVLSDYNWLYGLIGTITISIIILRISYLYDWYKEH